MSDNVLPKDFVLKKLPRDLRLKTMDIHKNNVSKRSKEIDACLKLKTSVDNFKGWMREYYRSRSRYRKAYKEFRTIGNTVECERQAVEDVREELAEAMHSVSDDDEFDENCNKAGYCHDHDMDYSCMHEVCDDISEDSG